MQVHCLLLEEVTPSLSSCSQVSGLLAMPVSFPLGVPFCHLNPAAALRPHLYLSLPLLQAIGSHTSTPLFSAFSTLLPQRAVASMYCDIPWSQVPRRKTPVCEHDASILGFLHLTAVTDGTWLLLPPTCPLSDPVLK